MNLFQDAKKLVATSANGYKHVWVVFDTDDFPADHINKTAQYCIEESTEDTIYHAIWSNQCIELCTDAISYCKLFQCISSCSLS